MTASSQHTAVKTKASASHQRAARRPGPRSCASASPLYGLQASVGNRAVSGALGTGDPLPPDVREEMESRFGADFSDVRIHDNSQSHASAAAWDAKAYTRGRDIVFASHRFAPHAGPGKRLLAHELAHVVQQRRGGATPVLSPQASHEQAADVAADAVASGHGNVAVGGATGVGVARDEDESWGAKLRRKYRETKEAIPPEYREKMQKAADFAADKTVDAVALPFGPAAAYAADGLGSALLHGAQKSVAGEEGASADIKNFGRDKVQEGLGAAKGVATQVTEVVDTAMWVGNEYKEARDAAAKKIGGKEGSAGNTIVKHAINVTARILPGMQSLPDLADASDAAKKVGLKDPDTGQASITAPMSNKLNEWAKGAEEKFGATPREPEMFTPMEKAELASSIGVQVALSVTGAEEVKIAMNVVGALSGLRGIVESIRREKDWKTSPRFWGGIIGLGLSIVGLKHSLAASKITTILLKFGWVVAAIPPLAHMAADYYTLETNPQMPEEEKKKLEESIKQDWIAAIHVIKDAILHVAQSQGGSSAKPGGDEGGPPPKAAGAVVEEPAAGPPKPATTAKAATDAPVTTEPVAPVTPKPVVNVAAEPTAAPPPIATGKARAQSAASRKLAADLAKQAPGKAGTVSKLPVRKTSEPPSTEPAQQKVPAIVEEKVAVGQTHGADGGTGTTGGKPTLRVVGGNEATVAAATPIGGKKPTVVRSGGGGADTSVAPIKGSAKTRTTEAAPGQKRSSVGKSAATATKSAELEAPAETAAPGKKRTSGAKVSGVREDAIEARLDAIDVPPKQRKAFELAADAVRKTAAKDPAAGERLLKTLEDMFAPAKAGSKSSEVAQEFEEAQGKLYPEKGTDNKFRQSPAADKRAQQEQAKPGGKTVLKARVRESERLGTMGGQEQAAKEGITVKDWNTPQQWKGEFGKGPDALGARGNKRQLIEFKGGRSRLGKSKGVVEMSNEWAGRKIAELEVVGDRATAAELLKAAREGNLQGVVYRTRQLKGGETTSRLKSHQLRDHLTDENIKPSGLIEYSPAKVERAYRQRLRELQRAVATGDTRRLRNL
jgi:hypothetical protein